MKVHFHPVVVELRFYEDVGKKAKTHYNNQDDYVGSAVIRIQGKKAWVSLLTGKFDRSIHRQIRDYLISQGCTRGEWESGGNIKFEDKT